MTRLFELSLLRGLLLSKVTCSNGATPILADRSEVCDGFLFDRPCSAVIPHPALLVLVESRSCPERPGRFIAGTKLPPSEARRSIMRRRGCGSDDVMSLLTKAIRASLTRHLRSQAAAAVRAETSTRSCI